jgi:hypothetical protein
MTSFSGAGAALQVTNGLTLRAICQPGRLGVPIGYQVLSLHDGSVPALETLGFCGKQQLTEPIRLSPVATAARGTEAIRSAASRGFPGWKLGERRNGSESNTAARHLEARLGHRSARVNHAPPLSW